MVLSSTPLSHMCVFPPIPTLTACPTCSTPPEVLAEKHPVVRAMLDAKTRKYAGTYKVGVAVVGLFSGVAVEPHSGAHHLFSYELGTQRSTSCIDLLC